MVKIRSGELDDPQVIALLQFHYDTNRELTPPESCHVFDLTQLKSPDVHFYSAWEGEVLLGVGALAELSKTEGEVKSMHTNRNGRRKGVGGAILQHIIDYAKRVGIKRLNLETGSFQYFAPARALYAAHGFVACGPYGDYKDDPNSAYMTLEI